MQFNPDDLIVFPHRFDGVSIFNRVWPRMRPLLGHIICCREISCEERDLVVQGVNAICNASRRDVINLVVHVKDLLRNHLEAQLDGIVCDLRGQMVFEFLGCWMKFRSAIREFKSIFMMYDALMISENGFNRFGFQQNPMLQIEAIGLEVWRTTVISPLGDELISYSLYSIDDIKRGDSVKIDNAQRLIDMYIKVDKFLDEPRRTTYQNLFETPVLLSVNHTFETEARDLMRDCNRGAYLKTADIVLQQEVAWAQRFVHSSTVSKFIAVGEHRLMVDQVPFLKSGFLFMVKNRMWRDLNKAYNILQYVPEGKAALVSEVLNYIKTRGAEIVAHFGDERVWDKVFSFVHDYENKMLFFVENIFHGDSDFLEPLNEALLSVLGSRQNPNKQTGLPQFVADYINAKLDNRCNQDRVEIEECLEHSVHTISLFEDKIPFFEHYANFLAERLFNGHFRSLMEESNAVDMILTKTPRNYDCIVHLKNMLGEYRCHPGLHEKFKSFKNDKGVEIETDVEVWALRSESWPIKESESTFILPPDLLKLSLLYENFFHAEYENKKKLTWVHDMGRCVLQMNYLKKTYTLTMNVYQVSVLMQFENTNRLKCRDIQESLLLDDRRFHSNVKSLVASKLLSSSTRDVTPETVLSLNLGYKYKKTVFDVNVELQKEKPRLKKKKNEENDIKQSYQTMILRIMRKKKIMNHDSLVGEVVAYSKNKFMPSTAMIVESIEVLIRKEYLSRHPDSDQVYVYMV